MSDKPWNPEVERIRKAMMERFSDKLSMEEIADFAYSVAGECTAPALQLGRCPLCGSDKADSFLGICATYNEQNEPAHIFHWASTSDSHRAKMRGRVATPQVTPTEGNFCTGDQDCRHTCELELDREADGRWIAELLGVAAYGPSKEEAIRNAAKVLIESTPQVAPRFSERYGRCDAEWKEHRKPHLDSTQKEK